jgi:V8-like Glu-specific endopeptidase
MKRIFRIAAAAMLIAGAGPAVAENPRSAATAVPGWEAVGRLNIAGSSMCTGSLIAPDLVLTAAHCLFDLKTGSRVSAHRIKFEAGLNGRKAKARRMVAKAVIHPAYRHFGSRRDQTSYDLAVLRLDSPISSAEIRPLLVAAAPLRGDSVDVMSYSLGRATRPSLQKGCEVLAAKQETLVMTCRVEHGASGSPVRQRRPGAAPQLGSVVTAKAQLGSRRVSLAAAFSQALQDLIRRAG